MLNRTTLMGRLMQAPTLSVATGGSAVTTFDLACYRDTTRSGNVDYIHCVAWKSVAVYISDNFRAGDQIVVDGRLRSRVYTTHDNDEDIKHSLVEILVDKAYQSNENNNQTKTK